MSKIREKNGRYDEHGKCMYCEKPLTEEFYGIDFTKQIVPKVLKKLKEVFFNVDFAKDGFFQGCAHCGDAMHAAYYHILNNPNEDSPDENVFYFANEKDFFVWFIETLVLNGWDIKPYLFDKTVSLAEKIELIREIKTEIFFAVKAKDGKLYY